MAGLIGAKTDEIIFTGSATESNNLAVRGLVQANRDRGQRVIFSEIEHYSIMHQADVLRSMGIDVDYARVDEHGMVDLVDLKKKLTPDTILVSIMHANLEIGTIEPIREVGLLCRERDVLLHSDGAGACGLIPVDVNGLSVDAMTLSAHQYYGPKGAAALYLRKGVRMRPIVQGGYQEMGMRAGTENVPAIVGMGEASRLAVEEMNGRVERLTALGRKLWKGIE